ncbi:hypothetical protein TcBrA4_0039500 [Trypanosoma cruzi]|nr:hypothetical protein TcBrA4_0039500 [Trypanosoma cruzi]
MLGFIATELHERACSEIPVLFIPPVTLGPGEEGNEQLHTPPHAQLRSTVRGLDKITWCTVMCDAAFTYDAPLLSQDAPSEG